MADKIGSKTSKYGWKFGHFQIGFGGVIGVVQAQADNLARPRQWRQEGQCCFIDSFASRRFGTSSVQRSGCDMSIQISNISAIAKGDRAARFGRKADFSVFCYSCEAHVLLRLVYYLLGF